MASGLQAGISDAGAGAGVGAMIGGPLGAGIGGAIGFLGGALFGGGPDPTAPMFSDVNLATDNPTLYAQLQQQQHVVDQIQALYDQRSQGMTAQEAQQYGQTMANTGQSLAHSGMAGTSMGLNQMNRASQDYQNNIAQRIMQQQQLLAQELTGAQSGMTQATQNALQQDYNAKLIPYQQAIGQAGNQNSMYNGLLSGGMNLLGTGLSQSNLQGLNANATGGALPGGYGYGMPGMGIGFGGGGYGAVPSMMPVAQPGSYSFNPAVTG